MPDLIRPSAPRTWRDRLAGLTGALAPSRLLAVSGAILVVGAAAWWLLRAPAAAVEDRLPMAPAATTPASAPTGAHAAPSTTATGADRIVVQAAGAIAHPGVYRLVVGARVTDLLEAAGGAAPDAQLDAVALAAKLVDGQRVYVPRVGEAVPAIMGGGSGPGEPTPTAPLDLNTADVDELDELPGVGPSTASAIVAYREEHGPFRSVEGLLEVRGIGPAKLDELRALVTV